MVVILIWFISTNERGGNWEWVCISKDMNMLGLGEKISALCGDNQAVIYKNNLFLCLSELKEDIKVEDYYDLQQPDNEAHHGEILTVFYCAGYGETNFTGTTEEVPFCSDWKQTVCSAPPKPSYLQILLKNLP